MRTSERGSKREDLLKQALCSFFFGVLFFLQIRMFPCNEPAYGCLCVCVFVQKREEEPVCEFQRDRKREQVRVDLFVFTYVHEFLQQSLQQHTTACLVTNLSVCC